MSIIKMKRLRVIALSEHREALLRDLMKLGCVEVTSDDPERSDPDWLSLVAPDVSGASAVQSKLNEIRNALETIQLSAKASKGLFAARRAVSADHFFHQRVSEEAHQTALEVNTLTRDIASCRTELGRLETRKAALLPWKAADVPLDVQSTRSVYISFGVCPSAVPFSSITDTLDEVTEAYKLELLHTDHEQHYLLLICNMDESDAIKSALKPLGFSTTPFREYTGTAQQNLDALEARKKALDEQIETSRQTIAAYQKDADKLETAVDALTAELARENARLHLRTTGCTVCLSGWVPAPQSKQVAALLEQYECAHELTDPAEGDSPPVSLYNSKLFYPFNMVTEMYSLPEYGSLDPNPLFGVFFALFFGLMYADIGYGLILLIFSIVAQKKFHLRKGTMTEQLFLLMGICGVTTIFWGALFGSFFGDAIGVFSENFLGKRFDLPPLAFNPISGNGPLTLLIICLGLGILQILFGMAIKAYMLIRDGRPWDALMDVGSWWLVFAGIAVLALGHGWYVMAAGFLALVLTQGRNSKGFFGKLLGGLGSLYDITAYLSDVLSYSRLMALCMASGVIASVFNILGGMTGPVFFWVVFLVGHAFNMGINIIGTYVHGARLQYLEFFGKWYREGGRAFAPLRIMTKYVDVVKNEQEEITV